MVFMDYCTLLIGQSGGRGRLQANQWFSHNYQCDVMSNIEIFDMAANFFGSLTKRYVEISNFLMIRLLCSMLPRIQNI